MQGMMVDYTVTLLVIHNRCQAHMELWDEIILTELLPVTTEEPGYTSCHTTSNILVFGSVPLSSDLW